jgi:carbon monoxide dehydrogenase subunit G
MARIPIYKEVDTIPSPIGQVWAILQGFGGIKTWMPTIDSCEVEGEGIGAVRTVMTGGNPVKEKLEIYDTKTHTVSYRLMDTIGLPMKGGFGTVSLEGDGDKGTKVTWVSDAEEIDEQGIQMLKPMFENFIKKSIGGLKEILARPGEALF